MGVTFLFYALEIVTAQHFVCAFTVGLTGILSLIDLLMVWNLLQTVSL